MWEKSNVTLLLTYHLTWKRACSERNYDFSVYLWQSTMTLIFIGISMLTNTPSALDSYLSTGVYYFVMHGDLVQLQTDWAARETFKRFIEWYPQTHYVTVQDFAKDFLSYHKIEWTNIWISGEYKTYHLSLEVKHCLQHVSLTEWWAYLSLYLVHNVTTLRSITPPLTL